MTEIRTLTTEAAGDVMSRVARPARRTRYAGAERDRLRAVVVEAYATTKSGPAAARAAGVSPPVAYALLREAGVEPTGGTARRVPPEQKAEAARLSLLYYSRQRKKSCAKVSKRLKREGFDVSDQWVWERVHAAGLVNGDAYKRGAPTVVEYTRRDGERVTLYLRGRHAPEVVRQALADYEDGASPMEIARGAGVSVSTLEKWVERVGVGRGCREAAVQRVVRERGVSPVWRRREVARLYVEEQMSSGALAERFGVVPAVIWHDLRAMGVTTRTRGEAMRLRHHGGAAAYEAFVAECARLRSEGGTYAEITAATGRTHATVKSAIETHAAREKAADAERACAFEATLAEQVALAQAGTGARPAPSRFRHTSLADRLRDGGHLVVRRAGGLVNATLVDADGTETPDQSPTLVAGVLQLAGVRIEPLGGDLFRVTLAAVSGDGQAGPLPSL